MEPESPYRQSGKSPLPTPQKLAACTDGALCRCSLARPKMLFSHPIYRWVWLGLVAFGFSGLTLIVAGALIPKSSIEVVKHSAPALRNRWTTNRQPTFVDIAVTAATPPEDISKQIERFEKIIRINGSPMAENQTRMDVTLFRGRPITIEGIEGNRFVVLTIHLI